jgi:hypothetical protein
MPSLSPKPAATDNLHQTAPGAEPGFGLEWHPLSRRLRTTGLCTTGHRMRTRSPVGAGGPRTILQSELSVDDTACAVTDRAYSRKTVLTQLYAAFPLCKAGQQRRSSLTSEYSIEPGGRIRPGLRLKNECRLACGLRSELRGREFHCRAGIRNNCMFSGMSDCTRYIFRLSLLPDERGRIHFPTALAGDPSVLWPVWF